MDDGLINSVKQKIFDYVRGNLSISEIYDWVSSREEFKDAIPHIKDKGDIIFFLMNKAGFETSSFYVDERLVITRESIVKNLKRLIDDKINPEELYNWADDIWNWEFIEGYEDQSVQKIIECLTGDPLKLKMITKEDYKDLISHLESRKNDASSLVCLEKLFKNF